MLSGYKDSFRRISFVYVQKPTQSTLFFKSSIPKFMAYLICTTVCVYLQYSPDLPVPDIAFLTPDSVFLYCYNELKKE